jgi:hypothetical protein
MQSDRSCSPAIPALAIESAIMHLLLDDEHPGPWTMAEIELEIGGKRIDVQDAISSLRRAGLLHVCGEVSWATRAARAMGRLEG